MSTRGKTAFGKMKYETANDFGVNLENGDNNHFKVRGAGQTNENTVGKVIEASTGNTCEEYDIQNPTNTITANNQKR